MDKDFTNSGKRKLLVIGNSYARDFVNMLLENNYADSFDISYKTTYFNAATKQRVQQADFIIIGNPIDSNYLHHFCTVNKVDKNKMLVVGTKNFGANNNLLFNTVNGSERYEAKVPIVENYLKINNRIKKEIGNNYIDLLALLQDDNCLIPVFTPNCKLISQDYKHLTKYGARYLGVLLVKDSTFQYFISHLQQFSLKHNKNDSN